MYPLTCTIQYSLFLERIMEEALSDCYSAVSIGGRPRCNLRFSDDIDLIGRDEEELEDPITRHDSLAKTRRQKEG